MSTIPPTILDSQAALDAGLAALARLDPVLEGLVAGGLAPALRRRTPGFPGLAGIIIAQQLSTASAAAIEARLAALVPGLAPAGLAAADDAALRAAGLSAAKVRTLRALAAAVAGGLDLDAPVDGAALHRALLAVPGIGAWTADVFRLFCLGHADAFPAGDLALQEAARLAYGLPARPRERDFLVLAEAWRPWRGIAATLLWAYYRRAKGREGVVAT